MMNSRLPGWRIATPGRSGALDNSFEIKKNRRQLLTSFHVV
jgi:hypothetical protein